MQDISGIIIERGVGKLVELQETHGGGVLGW